MSPEQGAATGLPRPWKAKTAVFLASQTISLLGSQLVQYAILWSVTLESQSGGLMTWSILAGFVPTFLLSPLAGVWADRYNRKHLILWADGFIALVTLGLVVLYSAGLGSLWALIGAQVLRALGAAVQMPAVGALLPQFVPQDQLARVNGLNSTLQSALMLVSPVLAGALLAGAQLEQLFWIDILTAAVAMGLLGLFLKVAPHAKAAEKAQVTAWTDLKLGLTYIREHRYLVPFFAYNAALLFLIAPGAFLTPLQVTRNFGAEVWYLTAIEIVFSLGMLAGGLILSLWGGLKNRMHTMLLSHALMALCSLFLGLSPWLIPYLIVMGLFGVAIPFYNSASSVLLQEHVEESYLGRVFSVQTLIFTSAMPLGMLVFGPLADLLSIDLLLVAAGALMLAQALWVLTQKQLLEAGLPPVPQTSAGPADAS